jgi:hypothetical protein
MTHFQIVTFGWPTYGNRASYYRSEERAIRDAKTLGGGSMTNIRVVECSSRADALDACISEGHRPVVWQR